MGFFMLGTNGLAILPNKNLVCNVGFNDFATHTKGTNVFSNNPVYKIQFPLIHPDFIIRDDDADTRTQKSLIKKKGIIYLHKSKARFFKNHKYKSV